MPSDLQCRNLTVPRNNKLPPVQCINRAGWVILCCGVTVDAVCTTHLKQRKRNGFASDMTYEVMRSHHIESVRAISHPITDAMEGR